MAELTATPVAPASDSVNDREHRPNYVPSLASPRARSRKREHEDDRQEAKTTDEKDHQLDVMA